MSTAGVGGGVGKAWTGTVGTAAAVGVAATVVADASRGALIAVAIG
jgi:hypothetical protein